MNPFGVANDSEKKISKIVMDKHLEGSEYLAFHPMDNSATVEIKYEDFLKFMTHFERKLDIVALEDGELEVKEEPKKAKKETKKEEKKEEEEGTLLKLLYKKEENFSKWY